jgi:hypothetical protein
VATAALNDATVTSLSTETAAGPEAAGYLMLMLIARDRIWFSIWFCIWFIIGFQYGFYFCIGICIWFFKTRYNTVFGLEEIMRISLKLVI